MKFPLLSLLLLAATTGANADMYPAIAQENVQTVSSDLQIPVVDMRDYYNPETRAQFIAAMKEAFSSYGFLRVRSPGLDQQIIDAAYSASKEFFSFSEADKMTIRAGVDGQRGYNPGERAKGSGTCDIKEFLHIAREPNAYPNKWPEFQPSLKEHTTKFFAALEQYAIPLQEAMAEALGLENKSIFSDMTKDGEVLLRSLHYFANPPQGTTWAAEHTDIDFFTTLPRATADGLQVEKNGQWIEVGTPAAGDEDTFIINIGDMLENMTNGIFKSAKHRVVVPEGADKERYSMVLFIHPRMDDNISPIKECVEASGGTQLYADGTRLEFLFERLIETGLVTSNDVVAYYANTGHTERRIDKGQASLQVMELLETKNLASPKIIAELNRVDADGSKRAIIRKNRELAEQKLVWQTAS